MMATMMGNGKNVRSLPEGWEFSTLGEIADLIGGGTPSRKNPEYFTGDIVWLTPTEIPKTKISVVSDSREKITQDGLRKSSARLMPKGSVLMTSRASIGYVAIAGTEVTTNQGFASFIPKEGINNFYLAYWLWANANFFIEHATGTTFKEITKSKLRNFSLPIPPLPEQERIVSRIEELFSDLEAGVASLERVRAGLKRYKASLLKAACEGKLLESRGVEISDELPEGWQRETLVNICSVFVDSAHRTPKYGDSGVPAIGPRDVVGGSLNLENARLVNEEEFSIQTRRHIPETGDIVYSRELSFGWGAIIPEGVKLCLSQGMCLFRTKDDVDNRYLLMTLNGPLGRKQAEDAATGSAHPHINLSDIKSYGFPIPPLDEQRRIVAEVERRLSVVGEVELAVEAGLVRAGRLRQSVLRSAFEGRLM